MAEKIVKSRIAHKHATEAVWNTHSTFVPKAGELIVFDADTTHSAQRFKMGDGSSQLSALPFIVNDAASKLVDTAINASSPGYNLPTSTAVTGYVTNAISGKADQATTYTKTEVDSLVSSLFRYKGNKATYSEVEALTTKAVGDVWFVTADSSEYAWNGTTWEKLGPVIDLSSYLTSATIAGLTINASSTSISKSDLLTALGVYTSTEVDTELAKKVDKTTTVNGHALSDNVTVTKEDVSLGNVANIDQSKAVKSITRNGTTFTMTHLDNTTSTFDQQDNDTTYTASAPISVSGTQITHDDSGVTSGSKGDTTNQTPTFGGTFKVPSGTVNATGHLTAFADHTVTIPNATATTSAAGLMSASDKSTLDGLATTVSGLETTVAGKVDSTSIGVASGVASLDSSGKVPSSQLPSYVDDVLEYSSSSSFPSTGETGKIYVDTTSNKTYRWGGSSYVEISESLALGTTSSTAYRGDYGNTAYTHASAKGSAYSSGLYKITTNSEGHVTAATAVVKSDLTDLGVADQSTTYTKTDVDTLIEGAGSVSKVNNISPDSNKNVTLYAGNINISSSDLTTVASSLSAKADQSTTYTKTETDSAISTAVGAVPQTAADMPMSSSDSSKLKTVLESTYVRTVNHLTPVNGNVTISSGSGDSVGLYRVDATIPVSGTGSWEEDQSTHTYKVTISNLTGVTSAMVLLEMYVDDDVAKYPVDVTTGTGSVTLETEQRPTVAWDQVHIVLGVDGADTFDDVTELKQRTTYSGISHNGIYRGKNLGDRVTSAQWTAISNGTFDDMFIGDFWEIKVDNVTIHWRIAAFDYWLNNNGSDSIAHHVVIVPDENLLTCKMNSSNVTTGAYVGSLFYTDKTNGGRELAIGKVNKAFGSSHILTYKDYLANAVTNGYESGQVWQDCTVELMNEQMVYGSNVFHNVMNGTNVPSNYTVSKSQLPLFQLDHSRIGNRADWWLRSVVSSSAFADVGSGSACDSYGASYDFGVRPAFGIK